jgi:hypothetical protein
MTFQRTRGLALISVVAAWLCHSAAASADGWFGSAVGLGTGFGAAWLDLATGSLPPDVLYQVPRFHGPRYPRATPVLGREFVPVVIPRSFRPAAVLEAAMMVIGPDTGRPNPEFLTVIEQGGQYRAGFVGHRSGAHRMLLNASPLGGEGPVRAFGLDLVDGKLRVGSFRGGQFNDPIDPVVDAGFSIFDPDEQLRLVKGLVDRTGIKLEGHDPISPTVGRSMRVDQIMTHLGQLEAQGRLPGGQTAEQVFDRYVELCRNPPQPSRWTVLRRQWIEPSLVAAGRFAGAAVVGALGGGAGYAVDTSLGGDGFVGSHLGAFGGTAWFETLMTRSLVTGGGLAVVASVPFLMGDLQLRALASPTLQELIREQQKLASDPSVSWLTRAMAAGNAACLQDPLSIGMN